MLYGIDNNILTSPLSLINSIILLLGISLFGEIVQKVLLKKVFKYNYKRIYNFYSPLVGTLIVIYILYIPLIFELQGIFFVKLLSSIIFLLGIYNLYLKKELFFSIFEIFKNKQSYITYSIIILYLLLFFIAASPITHADSLDYHFSGGLNILNLGHFHKDIIPVHNILVSIGEIIISIGLFFGAEQLGALVQYSSLLSLIPIFFQKKSDKIFLLAILICPITLFLVSSPKPQLIGAISSLLIFIFLSDQIIKKNSNHLKLSFFLIIFILCLNFLIKFSFIVSSVLLGLFSTYVMIIKKEFISAIFIILFAILITIFPFWVFKYNNFDTQIIDFFLSPLPINIYSFQYFHDFLTGGKISFLSMIYPLTLGKFTTTFGPSLILIILLINQKTLEYKLSILTILFFILIAIAFGSNLNRFLYEGFLWIIFLLSITYKNTLIFRLFKKITYLQTLIIMPIILYFILTIFPGSISDNYKKIAMSRTANGYDLSIWVNSKLKKNDVLLSTHRSISLFKNETYGTAFLWGVDFSKKESRIFSDHLKSKKINKIVFYGKKLNTEPLQNCLGNLLYFKEKVGKNVGRNPFNKKDSYSGWIYEFRHEIIPECLILKN